MSDVNYYQTLIAVAGDCAPAGPEDIGSYARAHDAEKANI